MNIFERNYGTAWKDGDGQVVLRPRRTADGVTTFGCALPGHGLVAYVDNGQVEDLTIFDLGEEDDGVLGARNFEIRADLGAPVSGTDWAWYLHCAACADGMGIGEVARSWMALPVVIETGEGTIPLCEAADLAALEGYRQEAADDLAAMDRLRAIPPLEIGRVSRLTLIEALAEHIEDLRHLGLPPDLAPAEGERLLVLAGLEAGREHVAATIRIARAPAFDPETGALRGLIEIRSEPGRLPEGDHTLQHFLRGVLPPEPRTQDMDGPILLAIEKIHRLGMMPPAREDDAGPAP
ncbi:hypothetical protein [Defluviimonas salinarum]|uniref:Uncharacterized protein n=1 Tax=Defluviimonas salinarum TaxID=2992147 RepID=A0ABT3J461_9RHOB|nr:hypothetical protein [Defluviimonas salinarum]MCW3782477.1 hypothetical protein [Defluviimonas salinarum]